MTREKDADKVRSPTMLVSEQSIFTGRKSSRGRQANQLGQEEYWRKNRIVAYMREKEGEIILPSVFMQSPHLKRFNSYTAKKCRGN